MGPLIAIANEEALFLLAFHDCKGLEREIERLCMRTKSVLVPGMTPIIHSIDIELKAYFQGRLTSFQTPLCLGGTAFQKKVWTALQGIPLGETRSYVDIAQNLAMPTAYRAVANANAVNQFAIIIPCHRVIQANGHLGGYAGGVRRKAWLLNHEARGII